MRRAAMRRAVMRRAVMRRAVMRRAVMRRAVALAIAYADPGPQGSRGTATGGETNDERRYSG
jgi:hypothetical protein